MYQTDPRHYEWDELPSASGSDAAWVVPGVLSGLGRGDFRARCTPAAADKGEGRLVPLVVTVPPPGGSAFDSIPAASKSSSAAQHSRTFQLDRHDQHCSKDEILLLRMQSRLVNMTCA